MHFYVRNGIFLLIGAYWIIFFLDLKPFLISLIPATTITSIFITYLSQILLQKICFRLIIMIYLFFISLHALNHANMQFNYTSIENILLLWKQLYNHNCLFIHLIVLKTPFHPLSFIPQRSDEPDIWDLRGFKQTDKWTLVTLDLLATRN